MRTGYFAMLAATLVATSAIAAPPDAADFAAMKKLARLNDAAWDAGDANAISTGYVADGTLRLSDAPEAFEGREAVRGYVVQSFAKRPAGFRHITKLDRVDMLTPDLAFTDASVRVEKSNPDGSWSLIREYRNNTIAVRQGKQWKLRTVRAYAQPAKPAP